MTLQAFRSRSQLEGCRNVSFHHTRTSTTPTSTMLISLTVGKVDAGVAVLLTQDKRLVCALPARSSGSNPQPISSRATTKLLQIEFPSILLPPNISSGSIVDITVSRNFASEQKSQAAFLALQDSIYSSFGDAEPLAPVLRCRNATQTSVVLEWDPIELATADIISLSLYRNGQKAGCESPACCSHYGLSGSRWLCPFAPFTPAYRCTRTKNRTDITKASAVVVRAKGDGSTIPLP